MRINSLIFRWAAPVLMLASSPVSRAADGDGDAAFNQTAGGSGDVVYALLVQPDGKRILGGSFRSVGGVARYKIARLNADGSLDSSFNPSFNDSSVVYSVVLQVNGKILVGGSFTAVTNGATATTRRHIARLNADGSLDTTFDPNVDLSNGSGASVNCMAVQADGKILLGGNFDSLQPNGAVSPTTRNFIARVNSDGTLDAVFNSSPNGPVRCVAVQTNGNILLGGEFFFVGAFRNYIARVNTNGILDTAFDPKASYVVWSVAVQADGKILLGGFFNTLQPNGAASPTTRNRIARLNADGTLDTVFNPNANDSITSLAVQADGKILLGGGFTSLQPNGAASPTTRNRIARVNSDGTLDTIFNPNAVGGVYLSVAVQTNGEVLAGGQFSSIGGLSRTNLALLLNGSAMQTLSAPSSSQVTWLRSGTAPEVEQVTFEVSTNSGVTWNSLGTAIRTNGGWQLSGLGLPASGNLRARGRTVGGLYSSSSGLVEQTAAFSFLAPSLSIQLSLTNSALVFWPAPSTGYVLQQNSNLGTANWINATDTVNLVNGTNQIIVSPPTGNWFYRLFHP